VNLKPKLFFGSCLCLVPTTRAQAQDGRAQAALRHRPSDTMFCFALGGAT
jgi:hypothetical protein